MHGTSARLAWEALTFSIVHPHHTLIFIELFISTCMVPNVMMLV